MEERQQSHIAQRVPRKQQQTPKLSGHTRDKRGCLTCRQRKKKCDVLPGTCGQCQRLNLTCVWEPERSLVPVSSSSTSFAAPSTVNSSLIKAPHPLQFWLEATDNGLSATLDRRLSLRYYVQTFSGLISTNAENNGFLSVLLPMAMESVPLLNTIIAWSSSHLALYRRDLQVKALENRSDALTTFATSFASGSLPNEIALAACLILVSMESILGDTVSWYDHMAGAASIIKHTFVKKTDDRMVSSLEGSLEGRWLLRNFAYHDILASVTVNRPMFIADLYWYNEAENVVDTYFGLASFPMSMLAEVTTLTQDLNRFAVDIESPSAISDGLEEWGVSQKAMNIEKRLLDWRPGKSSDASLVSLAETYRSAALIQLYRTLRFHRQRCAGDLHEKIATQANAIFNHVANMPAACLPECTLLFPIFIAGGETDDPDQRQLVRKRMQEVATYRRFDNVTVALSVLEEVWDVRTGTMPVDAARPYDWTRVLERRGWKLALS